MLVPQSHPPMNKMRSSQRYTYSKERELVRKGIERLEKQILQYIDVYISCDQVNIPLVKKCKTTDVPAVNSAIVIAISESFTEICGVQWNRFHVL